MAIDTIAESEAEALETGFRGTILTPDDPEYDGAREVWNGMIDERPALVARPTGVTDVRAAVAFAREHGRSVAVRGGGHGVAGTAVADDSVVVDLSGMTGVLVDPDEGVAQVQGGATWGDVDHETRTFGLVVPGGVVSTTGVAGLTLGGGYGWTRRLWGLTCDNLRAAEVVTADGEVRRASADENEDLFWALRGGGGNFGVVTCFEFDCHELGPEVYFLGTFYPLDDAEHVIRRWYEFVDDAPREVTADVVLWTAPDHAPFPEELHGTPFVATMGMYAGPVEDGEEAMAPLRELSTPLLDISDPMPYVAVQSMLDEYFPSGDRYYWKSHYLPDLNEDAVRTIAEYAGRRPSSRSVIPIRARGGAIADVDPEATAFGERSAPVLLSIDGTWADPAEDEANVEWVQSFWDAMRPHSTGEEYANFAMFDAEEERASFGGNAERLREVKARYDPENLFRHNANVRPSETA
ncbi:FAD-binding oxidoreductase [halophilic archaeon]|nr:FAD-binding oxidoreductase [halophilic archaeon]